MKGVSRGDERARTAFAILAVGLLLSTSAYIIYTGYMRQEERDRSLELIQMRMVESKLDELEKAVLGDLRLMTNEAFALAEKDVLSRSGERMDLSLERRSADLLYGRISDLLEDLNASADGYRLHLTGHDVVCTPVYGGVPSPVPPEGPGRDLNGTGPSELMDRCEVLGVAVDITCGIEFTGGEGICLKRDVNYHVEKPTVANLMESRMATLEAAVTSGELTRVINNMLSSLARYKTMLGYGSARSSQSHMSVLTDSEVSSCVDLALSMLVGAHLRCMDESSLSSARDRLWDSPGAGGCRLNATELTASLGEAYDPGILAHLLEGLGSEGNIPPMDTYLRPMLHALIDTLVVRLFAYLGIYDGVMERLGGLKPLVDRASYLLNTITTTVLGTEVIESGEKSSWEVMRAGYDERGMDESEIALMKRSYPDTLTWEGSEVDGYPLLAPETVPWSLEVHITDRSPGRTYLLSEDGEVFNQGEFPEKEGTYHSSRCDKYLISLELHCPPFEARFDEVPLRDLEVFREGIIDALSEDPDLEGLEGEMKAEGERILYSAIGSAIDLISGGGAEIAWEGLFPGWTEDDHPDPSGENITLSLFLGDSLPALDMICSEVAGRLRDDLLSGDLASNCSNLMSGKVDCIVGWTAANYNLIVGAEHQVQKGVERGLRDYLENCTIRITGHERIGTSRIHIDRAIIPPGGAGDMEWVLEQHDLVLDHCLSYTQLNSELEGLLRDEVTSGYHLVRTREIGAEGEMGLVLKVLHGEVTRGPVFDLLEGVIDAPTEELQELMLSTIRTALTAIEEEAVRVDTLCASRRLLAAPGWGVIEPGPWEKRSAPAGFNASVSIKNDEAPISMVVPLNGSYTSDLNFTRPPYRSRFDILYRGAHVIRYSTGAPAYGGNKTMNRTIDLDLDLRIELCSLWPLAGVEYSHGKTVWDDVGDTALEVALTAVDTLMPMAETVLGDSMGSLSELPPLLIDIMEGEGLDVGETVRVLTNITMDLSSSVRDTAKRMISELVDGGVSALMGELLRTIGIEELESEVELGGLVLGFGTELEALEGGEGSLLSVDFSIAKFGLWGHLGLEREEEGGATFNGTVEMDMGPLYLRIELDPMMELHPFMLGAQVVLDLSREIRFSFQVPALESYRSLEVSLSSTLGISPQIMIPPIGVSAFIDVGFEMRYRAPTEIGPVINEIEIDGGNITFVELFDPRKIGVAGSTVEMRDDGGALIRSWRLDPGDGMYPLFELSPSNLDRSGSGYGELDVGTVVLRSALGDVLDEVKVEWERSGWFSRDNDGFGVFRMSEGTPGEANRDTGMAGFDLRTLFLSLLVSSILEAWEEAYSLYGLSFNMLVHLVQRAIELLIERIISAVAELVLEVRAFVEIKLGNAGTGTAGAGFLLEFVADGDAFATFLMWVYENVLALIERLLSPEGGGGFSSFPIEVIGGCSLGAVVFGEVEMPPSVSRLVPDAVGMPGSLNIAVSMRFGLGILMDLMGLEVDEWEVSVGVLIRSAPAPLLSMLYDVNPMVNNDLWLLRGRMWME